MFFTPIFQFFLIILLIPPIYSNTECVQVIGRLLCKNGQKLVIGSDVELWELDSPLNVTWVKVNNEDGIFNLDGCGQDHDWLPWAINRPEFYLRVRHRCNNRRNSTYNIFNNTTNNTLVEEKFKMAAEQETKIVLPVFRKPPNPSFNINGTIENSTIFDWHLQHPGRAGGDKTSCFSFVSIFLSFIFFLANFISFLLFYF
uniref:Uncharacterized protein n=1 Tax=Meloidogyne enterolobii TaxID=390850 RepID=A0A6V7TPX9_MELEN|nr:unnamed protein product [Meloidogyne enterolobii]